MDTGATASIISGNTWKFIHDHQLYTDFDPTPTQGYTLDNSKVETEGTVWVRLTEDYRDYVLPFHIIPTYANDMLLGIDNLTELGYHLSRAYNTFTCHELNMDAAKEEIASLLRLDAQVKGPANCAVHRIKLKPGVEPIKTRFFPRNPAMQKIINDEVDQMLRDGIIEPSDSPWSSPVVMVKKKDKSHRFCVDLRKVNDASEKDAYPLPHINASLDKLRKAKYISTIDLKSGYWQILLDADSKAITAFTIPGRGLFQFRVMPFGLHSAPATFQRAMNTVLGADLEPYVVVYLDDIIVVGETLEQHMRLLREVFSRLRRANLKINVDKSRFLKNRTLYLGHVIDGEGIRTEPDKIKAIREILSPTTVKQLRQFLGMVSWYRRFIPSCADLTKPLTSLLQKRKRWRWGEKEQTAFETLKNKLQSDPILVPPDFTKRFTLQTDASNIGLGAVLTQIQDGRECVIAYASRSLNKAEQNYSVTEKECLAVVWGIQKMRPYLEGYQLTVMTDHQSLKWLRTMESPTGRVARWGLYLQQFDFDIVYRKGKWNKVADALSRNDHPDPNDRVEDTINSTIHVAAVEMGDPWYTRIKQGVETEPQKYPEFCLINGSLYRHAYHSLDYTDRGDVWKLCVRYEDRVRVLRENHDAPTAGHLGIAKTIARISRSYYWPRMRADITEYVRRCIKCQEFKPSQQPSSGNMGTIQATRPWEVVSADIVGPKPRSNSGMMYTVVFQDKFTKWIEVQPLRSPKSSAIGQALKDRILLRFGRVDTIITDNGTPFISREFTSLLENFQIRHVRTPPYSPQCNPVERVNRVIGTMIAQFVTQNQKTWDKLIPELTFAYNTARHESTQFTPAYLNYGREISPPMALYTQKGAISPHDHAQSAKTLADTIELVQVNLAQAYGKQSKYYNEKRGIWQPEVGDVVCKRVHHLSSAADNFAGKLANKF